MHLELCAYQKPNVTKDDERIRREGGKPNEITKRLERKVYIRSLA